MNTCYIYNITPIKDQVYKLNLFYYNYESCYNSYTNPVGNDVHVRAVIVFVRRKPARPVDDRTILHAATLGTEPGHKAFPVLHASVESLSCA